MVEIAIKEMKNKKHQINMDGKQSGLKVGEKR